jgi:hypothetical protein
MNLKKMDFIFNLLFLWGCPWFDICICFFFQIINCKWFEKNLPAYTFFGTIQLLLNLRLHIFTLNDALTHVKVQVEFGINFFRVFSLKYITISKEFELYRPSVFFPSFSEKTKHLSMRAWARVGNFFVNVWHAYFAIAKEMKTFFNEESWKYIRLNRHGR